MKRITVTLTEDQIRLLINLVAEDTYNINANRDKIADSATLIAFNNRIVGKLAKAKIS